MDVKIVYSAVFNSSECGVGERLERILLSMMVKDLLSPCSCEIRLHGTCWQLWT